MPKIPASFPDIKLSKFKSWLQWNNKAPSTAHNYAFSVAHLLHETGVDRFDDSKSTLAALATDIPRSEDLEAALWIRFAPGSVPTTMSAWKHFRSFFIEYGSISIPEIRSDSRAATFKAAGIKVVAPKSKRRKPEPEDE